jgi:hypothetical protein
MEELYAIILLLAMLGLVVGLVGLLFKRWRRRAKWIALGSVVALVFSAYQFAALSSDIAKTAGFKGAADHRAAKEAGVEDPAEWEKIREHTLAQKAAEKAAAKEKAEAEAAARKARKEAEARANDPETYWPDIQRSFVETIRAARSKFEEAANDMAKGGERVTRAKEVCKLFGVRTGGQSPIPVENWVGRVNELSSNNDGWGVLTVEIDDSLSVATHNNSFSDSFFATLIDPSTELFRTASSLEKNQIVRFSGVFDRAENDCLSEISLTQAGAMRDPQFIIRFQNIEPVDTQIPD